MDAKKDVAALELLLADLDRYIKEQRILVWPELAMHDEYLADQPPPTYFDYETGRVA